jgi:DNA-binding IclR family transcriptional regulator
MCKYNVKSEVHIVKNNRFPGEKKYLIKVLRKAFLLLDLFDEEVQEISAAEISDRLKFDKSTVFRLLRNLEEEGYLDRDPETDKYRLGLKIFFMGNLVKPYRFLKEAAKPLLERLNRESGETVHLAVLHKGEALYLDKIESKHTVRVVLSQIGRRLPAHCSGVGKMLLAHLAPEDVQEIVAEKGLASFTRNTITDYDQLKAELARVAQTGISLDNEEIEVGLKCAAAPVFFGNRVRAALSVSVPKDRFDKNHENLVRMLVDTAQELSSVLDQSLRGKVKVI